MTPSRLAQQILAEQDPLIDRADWSRLDLALPDAVDDACADLGRGPLAEHATLLNDPRWVGALADGKKKHARTYTLRRQGALVGLATFLVHPSAVRLALGDLTLLSFPVDRLNGLAAPLVDAVGDRQREISHLIGLFSRIKQDLRPNEVIFLESVVEGTAMFDLVAKSPTLIHGFHALRNGNLYRHRFATVTDSLEGYLKQLGARTRADLRANRKRFTAQVRQNYHTKCFRTQAEVPEFVAAATELSRKTYQYRLLGSGLREREALERRYLAASRHGWFRSYILYAAEKPIAFQVGFVYRGRFQAQEIGYDPEWARHHVGIFLHTEIIVDLARDNGTIKEFDFGNGDNLHKKRLSTISRVEGYFYLIPSHFRGRMMVRSKRVADRASAALGAVLGRLGIRKKTRDLVRRLVALK